MRNETGDNGEGIGDMGVETGDMGVETGDMGDCAMIQCPWHHVSKKWTITLEQQDSDFDLGGENQWK